MFGSYEPFLEIFSSKKFSRVVVYCSVIKVPVVLFLRQLWYFIKSDPLCQELFYFSFLSYLLPFRSASSDSLYRLSHQQGVVNSFFMPPAVPPPRLRLTWFPAAFKAPSSATGAILSLQDGIVNVFSVFYLFQTIHAILTESKPQFSSVLNKYFL